MPNRFNPGCNCCECFVDLTYAIDSGTGLNVIENGVYMLAESMPTLDQWTAIFEIGAAINTPTPEWVVAVFGCDDDGVGGYRVVVTRSLFASFYTFTATLIDRSDDSTVATKQFLLPSSGYASDWNFNVILNQETCVGQPYDPTITVYLEILSSSPSLSTFLRCFELEVTDSRWGTEEGLADAVGYGYRDPALRDLSSGSLPLCHICGIKPQTFGEEGPTVCTGNTLKIVVSGLPSYITFTSGLNPDTYEYFNADDTNGTYLISAECPDCVYKNELFSLTYSESFNSGPLTPFVKIHPLVRQFWRVANEDVLVDGTNYVTMNDAEPAFLDLFYTFSGSTTTDTDKYYKVSPCKWIKPGTTTHTFPLFMARIEVEWLT